MSEHPITPPPKLIRKWNEEAATAPMADQRYIAIQAAQWGADQELEACIDVILAHPGLEHPELLVEVLRDVRRPKPPSLAEQALAKTEAILNDPNRALLTEVREALELNRRALERLQGLEKGNE